MSAGFRRGPRVCLHVFCSVFNIGSERFAPVAAGRPSRALQLRRDLEARRSGRGGVCPANRN